MNETFSLSLQGVRHAVERLDQAARKIARSSIPEAQSTDPAQAPSEPLPRRAQDSLPVQLVYVLKAGIDAKANLKVLEVKNETEQDLLDLFS